MIEDVRIDGGRELLDDALRQVEAARTLFGGAEEPQPRSTLPPSRSCWGCRCRLVLTMSA